MRQPRALPYRRTSGGEWACSFFSLSLCSILSAPVVPLLYVSKAGIYRSVWIDSLYSTYVITWREKESKAFYYCLLFHSPSQSPPSLYVEGEDSCHPPFATSSFTSRLVKESSVAHRKRRERVSSLLYMASFLHEHAFSHTICLSPNFNLILNKRSGGLPTYTHSNTHSCASRLLFVPYRPSKSNKVLWWNVCAGVSIGEREREPVGNGARDIYIYCVGILFAGEKERPWVT